VYLIIYLYKYCLLFAVHDGEVLRLRVCKCNRKKNSEKYENYANNTAYDKWLCFRMILKIMQYLASKRFCQ
jgi:hypothetical protein